MFENLRNEAGFIEDEEHVEEAPLEAPKKKKQSRSARPVYKRRRTFDQMTGTTPFQRFVLACMLLITVCLLGTMFLLFTEKIVPSFLY